MRAPFETEASSLLESRCSGKGVGGIAFAFLSGNEYGSTNAMQTHELLPTRWIQALDAFSATHEGRPVSMEVLGPDIGAQPEIESLPLLGVSADRSAVDATLTITAAGAAESGHVTRIVHGVTRVYLERTDGGDDAALEVEAADGTRTILRLGVPARKGGGAVARA